MADDILYVVEHIEAELQRLGRLVATLRRRIEAQGPDAARMVSGPAPTPPTPPPLSATRTVSRPSSRRFPGAVEEQEDDSMVRTAAEGSSYGFVREAVRHRSEVPSEPVGLHEQRPLDRRTR